MISPQQVIVIDNGSSSLKSGFSGDDAPRAVFPSIVGRPRHSGVMVGMGFKDSFIGDEAQSKRAIMSLKYPIQNGIIKNWDDMEKIWHHNFYNELRVDPEEYHILTSDPPMNPKDQRAKMTQIMFESFNVLGINISFPASLILQANQRVTGVVVESGDGVTSVSTIYEGFLISKGVQRIDFGGSNLTNYLVNMLNENGHSFLNSAEREVVKTMKESISFVSNDFESDMKKHSKTFQKEYELPDGEVICVGHERFKCGESIFRPELVGKQGLGIHEMVFNSIMKCDIDARKDFFSNVVLSGGNTMIQGFKDRFLNELKSIAPDLVRYTVRVVDPPERKSSLWIGGSILSQRAYLSDYMSKEEYEEKGPYYIDKKCIFW